MSEFLTPGPWIVQRSTGEIHATDRRVCSTQNGGIYNTADARLIAAAPDLLSALIDMFENRYCLCDSHIDNARNAITKATVEQR